MAMADPDRDLLFALMALRSNLMSAEELLSAAREVAPGETRSLGEFLIGRGILRGDEVAAIEREMADRSGTNGSGVRTPSPDWSRVPETGAVEIPATRVDPFATRPARHPIAGDDPFATRAATSSFLSPDDSNWAGEPPDLSDFAN